jgi:hypothetical protein
VWLHTTTTEGRGGGGADTERAEEASLMSDSLVATKVATARIQEVRWGRAGVCMAGK